MSRWLYFAGAGFLIGADQFTKSLIVGAFALGESLPITDFFSLSYVRNYGAAFSFLADSSGWQRYFLASVAAAAVVALSVWIIKTPAHNLRKLSALALILAGAAGNLIDRVAHGFVVDFLDLHYHTFYWPVFNLADSWIFIGVVLLLIEDWRK